MFNLYTILWEIGNGFINNVISAENYEVALSLADHEVIDTDPQYAWLSRAQSCKTHIQGP